MSEQPDISYYPNFDKYKHRTERRLKSEQLDNSLRYDLPQRIISSSAWGKSIAESPDSWLYHLDAGDIDEINEAVAHFECTNTSTKEHNSELQS